MVLSIMTSLSTILGNEIFLLDWSKIGESMKRVLMTATVPSMIGQFNMDNIKLLQELGYTVDVACNFDDYSVWNRERIKKFESELKELKIKK